MHLALVDLGPDVDREAQADMGIGLLYDPINAVASPPITLRIGVADDRGDCPLGLSCQPNGSPRRVVLSGVGIGLLPDCEPEVLGIQAICLSRPGM